MANEVTVELRNPPSEATMWSLTLTDWDMTVLIDFIGRDEKRLDITEAATFEIPEGVKFPLRVAILQITKWNEDMTALIQLYYAQSMHPTLWDSDIGDYGDEPDPTYRELFIPELGSYYFDFAVPGAVLWPLAIIGGLGVLGIGAAVVLSAAKPRE